MLHAAIVRVKSFLYCSILSLFLGISSPAFATVFISSVSGTSYNEVDTAGGITTVYGGMAGTCAGDGVSTCNSCTNATAVGAAIQACNLKSVYPNLPISVTFSSDQTLTNATARLYTDDGDASTAKEEIGIVTGINTVPGVLSTVSTTWGKLCENDSSFGASSACTVAGSEAVFANTSRKIYLRVDQNADGDDTDDGEEKSVAIKLHYVDADDISLTQQTFCNSVGSIGSAKGMCGFKLGRGDSKLYLEELYGNPTLQTTGAPAWYGIALSALPVAGADAIPHSSGLSVRPLTADNFVQDNTIEGLQNYVNHCVLMGNVNKAQNIYFFSNAGTTSSDVCAEPSEVIGMLTDKSCFISTAAFGSDMADQVQLLRSFRDQFLIPHKAGRAFVKLYYQISPPIAHVIENSEILKAATRTFLYPFIGLA